VLPVQGGRQHREHHGARHRRERVSVNLGGGGGPRARGRRCAGRAGTSRARTAKARA
jgi:hypothetical protein